MDYAEQLSFKIYLDSVIPRNCSHSKGTVIKLNQKNLKNQSGIHLIMTLK